MSTSDRKPPLKSKFKDRLKARWFRLGQKQWYSLSLKDLIYSIFFSMIWMIFIASFGSKHFTIKAKWQDHVSNVSSAYLFATEGIAIYQHPVESFVTPVFDLDQKFIYDLDPAQFFRTAGLKVDQYIYLVWPNVPRPYPVYAWFYFAPFSVLYYVFEISLGAVLFLQQYVFILFAHLCFFVFFHFFKSQNLWEEKSLASRGLLSLTLFVIYSEVVLWSANGMYDQLPLLLALFGLLDFKNGNWKKCLFWISTSLLLHLRAILILGIFLPVILRKGWGFFNFSTASGQNLSIPKQPQNFSSSASTSYSSSLNRFSLLNIVSVLQILVAAYIFYYAARLQGDSALLSHNDWYFKKILLMPAVKIVSFLLVLGIYIFYFVKKKMWEVLGYAVSIHLPLMFTPMVQSWYVLFMLPLFLFYQPRNVKNLLVIFSFYTLTAMLYPNNSPFQFNLVKDSIEVIYGNQL